MEETQRENTGDVAKRVGYTVAGAALGSVAGRALGWMLLGPLGYRVGQGIGAVAGGALGFKLSAEPAEPARRTADREPAVVPKGRAGDNVIEAVFG